MQCVRRFYIALTCAQGLIPIVQDGEIAARLGEIASLRQKLDEALGDGQVCVPLGRLSAPRSSPPSCPIPSRPVKQMFRAPVY